MLHSIEKLLATPPSQDNNDYDYMRFNLRNDLQQLYAISAQHEMEAIAASRYFIVPKKIVAQDYFWVQNDSQFFRIGKSACKFVNCDMLDKHQLMIGHFSELLEPLQAKPDYEQRFVEFKNRVLACQLFWSRDFLNRIYAHLKNRRANKDNLLNKEAIQIALGEVIAHIKAAEVEMTHVSRLPNDAVAAAQLLAMKEFKSANQILAKLYGGRAFLSGNVIEMIMVFEYFRDIYFN